MKAWLSVEEAALLTQRSKWTIYKWISRGKVTPRIAVDGTMEINAKRLLAVEADTRPGRRPNAPRSTRRECA